MGWVLYALLSAFLYTLVGLVDKFIVDNEIENYQLASAFCGIPIYTVFISSGLLLGSPFLPFELMALGTFLGFIYTFSLFSYYSGLSKEEASRFIPLLSLNTVFLVFLSFIFLDESFSVPVYAGITSVVVGGLLISLKDPLESLRRFKSTRAVYIGVLSALLSSFSALGVKYMTGFAGNWSIMFWLGVGGILSTLVLLFHNRNRLNRSKIRGYEHLLTIGLLTSVGYIMFVNALSRGPASLVSTFLKTKSVILFFATILLTRIHPDLIHEELDRKTLVQKAVAILMILGGVAIIHLL